MDKTDPAYKGQSGYNPAMLAVYDLWVLGFMSRAVLHVPVPRFVELYRANVGHRHLDVGPGTGYYLDRCRFPADAPAITLLDANVDVLRYAARRLERYGPATRAGNVLKPIDAEPASFRSAALSYVLHCLPGALDAKAAAFDNVIRLVAPGGVVFGTTILGTGVEHTRLARTLIRAYNRKGIFANLDDDRGALERCLTDRFHRYELEVSGSVALFAGWIA